MSKLNLRRKILKHPRIDGVAPPNLLKDDFNALDSKAILRCSYDIEQLLMMQSVQGHAHEGHGAFYGRRYPNTSMDDIARALRMDPLIVKEDRQELIDEVRDFVSRAVAGEKLRFACNEENEPFLRCSALRNFEIDPHGVLQGLYLGGLRDDAEIRSKAHQKYGVEIGYGKCFLINQKVLKKLGLDGYKLAREPHEQEIDFFEQAGLFAHNGDHNVDYMYIRYVLGPGASDDAAILFAGKLYGISAAVGCFLADAVDTLEKYVPEYSDQDSGISDYIEATYPNLGLTRDDAADLAYLASIPREMQGHLPDSSLRHMLEIDTKQDQSAIESHLCYIAGRPYSPMDLDRGECTNIELYEYIETKLEDFRKNWR